MGMRGIDRFLEQWEMNARDLHRRMILAPTPRELECWHALWLWRKDGRPAVRRRLWGGIRTPSADGLPPSARAGLLH